MEKKGRERKRVSIRERERERDVKWDHKCIFVAFVSKGFESSSSSSGGRRRTVLPLFQPFIDVFVSSYGLAIVRFQITVA